MAALADQGPTRGAQQYFVNGRIVKDRTIAHAVIDAYSTAMARERSPEAHLFIEMPPDTVDVNVHPTKAEVRFRHQSLVHEVVRRSVQDAIGGGGAPELRLAPPAEAATGAVNLGLPSLLSGWQPGSSLARTGRRVAGGRCPPCRRLPTPASRARPGRRRAASRRARWPKSR